jgi:diguanylate cyclase (GGDEF)-like protein/PAS domain S-box-containing protein
MTLAVPTRDCSPAAGARSAHGNSDAQQSSDGSPLRVLLLEDRRSDAVLVQEMLRSDERTTFACRHASTLREALLELHQANFDCVLVDMNLPDSEGLETLHCVQAASQTTAVIVLTGLDDSATAEAAVVAGAQDYLTKGRLDAKLLGSAVRHAVERKRIHAQLLEREQQAQSALDERTSALAALAESETRYRSVLSALQEGVLLHDAGTKVITFNESAQQILGLTPAQLLGCPASRLGRNFVGANGSRIRSGGLPVDHALRSGKVERQVVCLTRRDGSTVWLELTSSPLNDPTASRPAGVVTSLVDITERQALEQRLSELATHDSLTGLPNRVVLTDRTELAMKRMRRRGSAVALLFIDLDHFKSINDSHGHDAGDQLLVQTAARLRLVLRVEDTLARLGGDELVALCEDLGSADDAAFVAGRLMNAFAQPFVIAGVEVSVSASIGVAMAQAGVSPEQLLRRADSAMYGAKSRGRAQFEFYDEIT